MPTIRLDVVRRLDRRNSLAEVRTTHLAVFELTSAAGRVHAFDGLSCQPLPDLLSGTVASFPSSLEVLHKFGQNMGSIERMYV